MLCIGPAGEAGVAYSSIVADGSFMAEPAGTGAIMANKRVKAIAVRGDTLIAPADARRAEAVSASIARRIATSELATGIRQFGSLFYSEHANEWGALTGRNGQDGRLPQLQSFSRETLTQRGKREPRGCEVTQMPTVTEQSAISIESRV